jgi:hypothetical protein
MNIDVGVHIAEVVAIVFWIGVSYGDIKWIKSELGHLREIVEAQIFLVKKS